jgi:hypothetical protein
MSYIYDPDLVELLGGNFPQARALDDQGRWLMTHHRQTGLWCDASIPKTGWTCTRVHLNREYKHDDCDCGMCEDGTTPLPGEPGNEWIETDCVCEMCEVARIKWVHTMRHPEYPDPIEVGKICAGLMQQNMEAAEQHERYAKAVERARRRHALGIKTIRLAMIGARRSDWMRERWIEDDEWPTVRRNGQPGPWGEGRVKAKSFMTLEGIGEYWLMVNRHGLRGFGAHVGTMWRGQIGYGGWKSNRTYGTAAEAQEASIRIMGKQWRMKLDKGLDAVIARNKAVNERGEAIDLG